MDKLEEIRQRTEAATPGPWMVQNGSDVFTEIGADNGNGAYAAQNDAWQVADCDIASGTEYCIDVDADGAINYGSLKSKSNAAFIANAREDIPYLLSEVDRLGRDINVLTARAEAAKAERDACKADLQSIVTQSVKDMEKRNWTPPCRYCSKYFVCDYIPEESGCCFEWRGPQAGKGETNGNNAR